MASSAELAIIIRAKNEAQKVLDDAVRQFKSVGGAIKVLGPIGAAALGAAGAAALKFADDFDNAYDTIRTGTGATGDVLKGLQKDFKDVFASIPTDMQSAATAVADLNTRTGASGETLREMSKNALELSRLTGTDLQPNIQGIARAMADWGVANRDGAGFMDKLFVAGQKTGIGIQQLTDGLVKYGAPMRQVGFTTEEAIALLAEFERQGVNSELVMGSIRIALGKMAKDGEPAIETFQRIVAEIANAGSTSEANKLALEAFGARAGPDMAAAIREGRFEIGALVADLGGAQGAIQQTARDTNDWRENLTILRNQGLVALEPVLVNVTKGLNVMADFMIENKEIVVILAATIATVLVAAFVAWTIAAIAAASATTLALLGIPVLIGAIIAGVVLLVKHWDAVWSALKAAPAALLSWLKDNWLNVLLALLGPAGWGMLIYRNWTAIWSKMPEPIRGIARTILGIFDTMANTVIGIIEWMVRQIGSVADKLPVGGINKVIGFLSGGKISLPDLSGLSDITLPRSNLAGTIPPSLGGISDGWAAKAEGQWASASAAAANAAVAAELAVDPFNDLGAGVGGAGAAAEQAENGLADLMRAYQAWTAVTGGSLPQFVALVEMKQREAQLDREIAEAQFRVAIEQEKVKDSAGSMRIALKELALEALRTGKSMAEVMRDAFQKVVDEIRGAFDKLFSRPTREEAQLNLEIALLEEERARQRAAGATEEEIDHINDQIEALRNQADVYSAHEAVLRAQIDAADQSLITADQQDFAAKLYIAAMNTESGQLAAAADQAGLEMLARANLIDAMNQSADAHRMAAGMSQAEAAAAGSQAVWDSLNAQEKHDLAVWLEMMASRGLLHTGTPYVPRTGPYILEEGERVLSREQARRFDSRQETGGSARPVVQHIHIHQLVAEHSVPEELRALGLAVN